MHSVVLVFSPPSPSGMYSINPFAVPLPVRGGRSGSGGHHTDPSPHEQHIPFHWGCCNRSCLQLPGAVMASHICAKWACWDGRPWMHLAAKTPGDCSQGLLQCLRQNRCHFPSCSSLQLGHCWCRQSFPGWASGLTRYKVCISDPLYSSVTMSRILFHSLKPMGLE